MTIGKRLLNFRNVGSYAHLVHPPGLFAPVLFCPIWLSSCWPSLGKLRRFTTLKDTYTSRLSVVHKKIVHWLEQRSYFTAHQPRRRWRHNGNDRKLRRTVFRIFRLLSVFPSSFFFYWFLTLSRFISPRSVRSAHSLGTHARFKAIFTFFCSGQPVYMLETAPIVLQRTASHCLPLLACLLYRTAAEIKSVGCRFARKSCSR